MNQVLVCIGWLLFGGAGALQAALLLNDTTGAEGIRMHGPSMNAPVGANSQVGWTLRVMDNAGNYFDNAGNVVPYRANEGHIPLLGNPNAP